MIPFQTYRTLFGENVDVGQLPKRECQCVAELLALKNQNDTTLYPDLRSSQRFLSQARRVMRNTYFLTHARYLEALDGSVGAIFRDCFYRLHLDATLPDMDDEGKKRFVERLRHNPARMLMDDFLGAWNSRRELATAAEFVPSTITRLFNYVWRMEYQEGEKLDLQNGLHGFMLSRFHKTCERLNLVPHVSRPRADVNVTSGVSPTVSMPLEPSWRETCLADLHAALSLTLQLRHAVAEVDPDDVVGLAYQVAAFYLTLLYGIEDVRFVTWRSAELIKRLLRSTLGLRCEKIRGVHHKSTASSVDLTRICLPLPASIIDVDRVHALLAATPIGALFADQARAEAILAELQRLPVRKKSEVNLLSVVLASSYLEQDLAWTRAEDLVRAWINGRSWYKHGLDDVLRGVYKEH